MLTFLTVINQMRKNINKNSIWLISRYGRVIVMDVAYVYTEMPRP